MSQLDYGRVQPILVPKELFFTKLLIADAHAKTMHRGPQLMITYLRAKYWIVGVKTLARGYVRNCGLPQQMNLIRGYQSGRKPHWLSPKISSAYSNSRKQSTLDKILQPANFRTSFCLLSGRWDAYKNHNSNRPFFRHSFALPCIADKITYSLIQHGDSILEEF